MNERVSAPVGYEDRLDVLYNCAFRAANKILNDRTRAEDVAEEAMVRAYAKWAGIADHAEAWVTRVASNLAISEWRHRRHDIDAAHAPTSQPVPIADLSVDRIDLVQAVSQLSRRQREVVTLRYLMDMSEADVSEALRCSTGSVSRHTARALARLRVVMAPVAPEVQADA